MKRKRNYQKILRVFVAVIFGITALLSVSGCRTSKTLLDYPKVWSCDYEDFKLEFTVTGFRRDTLIPATLYLDGEAINVMIFIGYPPQSFYITCLSEDFSREEYFKKRDNIIEGKYQFTRRTLTVEILKDKTNREGKESLVGKKYLFHGRDITAPEAKGYKGDIE